MTRVARLAALAAAYFLCAKLGLALATVNASVTPVWPPTGLALAACVLWGAGCWPGVFAGALLANLATSGSAAASLGIAAGNTLEALAGAWLLARYAGGASSLGRVPGVGRFALFGAGVAPLVSATVGVASLLLAGQAARADAPAVWLTWWVGDAMGALLVAPLILLWAQPPEPREAGLGERAAVGAAALLAAAAVFSGWLPSGRRGYPLEFLCLVPVMWTALRLGQRDTATLSALLASAAVWGTRQGHGPFGALPPGEGLPLLQAFMGTLAVMALAAAAVADENRRALATLLKAQDALRLRVRERDASLDAAAARLAHSYQELDEFTAAAAHDLRSPLRVIASFTEAIAEGWGGRLDPEGGQYLVRIRDAALRGAQLVDDLLNASRTFRAPLSLEKNDLCAMARSIMDELRAAEPRRRVDFVCSARTPVVADQRLLRLLLQNLIANAWKFTGKAERPLIEVGELATEEGCAFYVRDNGAGFDMAHAGRLFTAFHRLHSAREYPGSGIGLSTVRRIATRHGGSAWAEGRKGEGATFFVRLPGAARGAATPAPAS
jgi:signal transduction histidine kinase